MTFRLSRRAFRDLEEIFDYIAEGKPDAAAHTVEKILQAIQQLERYPQIGRFGRRAGTRELAHPPFVIVYRMRDSLISVDAILHGRRAYE